MRTRVVAVIAAVLLLGATPSPSPPPPSQPLAAPSVPPGIGNVVQSIINKVTGDVVAPLGVDPNHVRGQVTYFRRFDLQIAMPLQTYKQIHLHQGTIINPRGATISDGQTVDVVGTVNGDGSINANEITIVHG
jgi:hypothetical protein